MPTVVVPSTSAALRACASTGAGEPAAMARASSGAAARSMANPLFGLLQSALVIAAHVPVVDQRARIEPEIMVTWEAASTRAAAGSPPRKGAKGCAPSSGSRLRGRHRTAVPPAPPPPGPATPADHTSYATRP